MCGWSSLLFLLSFPENTSLTFYQKGRHENIYQLLPFLAGSSFEKNLTCLDDSWFFLTWSWCKAAFLFHRHRPKLLILIPFTLSIKEILNAFFACLIHFEIGTTEGKNGTNVGIIMCSEIYAHFLLGILGLTLHRPLGSFLFLSIREYQILISLETEWVYCILFACVHVYSSFLLYLYEVSRIKPGRRRTSREDSIIVVFNCTENRLAGSFFSLSVRIQSKKKPMGKGKRISTKLLGLAIVKRSLRLSIGLVYGHDVMNWNCKDLHKQLKKCRCTIVCDLFLYIRYFHTKGFS